MAKPCQFLMQLLFLLPDAKYPGALGLPWNHIYIYSYMYMYLTHTCVT